MADPVERRALRQALWKDRAMFAGLLGALALWGLLGWGAWSCAPKQWMMVAGDWSRWLIAGGGGALLMSAVTLPLLALMEDEGEMMVHHGMSQEMDREVEMVVAMALSLMAVGTALAPQAFRWASDHPSWIWIVAAIGLIMAHGISALMGLAAWTGLAVMMIQEARASSQKIPPRARASVEAQLLESACRKPSSRKSKRL